MEDADRGSAKPRSFASSRLLLSLRLVHPSVRWRGVGLAFSLPGSFHWNHALSPLPSQLQALQRRWVGPVGCSGPAPQHLPGEEAESQRLGENGRAAENSSAPHSRFWPGHHNLRGTERCLLKLILVLGSDWEGFFFFFPSSPETFLFHTQPSLPACRSCLPRPPPLPNPPALHQGCYPVAQIGGANSR